jgi:hypothetical protein
VREGVLGQRAQPGRAQARVGAIAGRDERVPAPVEQLERGGAQPAIDGGAAPQQELGPSTRQTPPMKAGIASYGVSPEPSP